MKEEREKVGLKLKIQKTKTVVSGPITLWEIDGETGETVADFLFWGAPKSLQLVTAAMKLKDAYSLAALPICSDFGAPKIKVSHCFHCFPIYFP